MATYISAAEAATMLGISEQELFLQSKAMGGCIPVLQAGGSGTYTKEDIEDFRSGRLKGSKPLSTEQTLTTESEFFAESYVDSSGLVRNVLLCGNKSKNGYDIPPRAFGSADTAKRLYEGKPVFIDHAQRGQELARSVREMAGVVKNVTLRSGRPYGDIDTDGYPSGAELAKIARAKPHGVGMSHVADYKFSRDRFTVEEVRNVVSIDVVFRPATTNTFFERAEKPAESKPLPEGALLIGAGYR